jgi:hypothetical protein
MSTVSHLVMAPESHDPHRRFPFGDGARVVITTMDGLLLFELITEQRVNQQRREISGDLLSQGSSLRQWLCALSIQQAF